MDTKERAKNAAAARWKNRTETVDRSIRISDSTYQALKQRAKEQGELMSDYVAKCVDYPERIAKTLDRVIAFLEKEGLSEKADYFRQNKDRLVKEISTLE